MVSLGQVVFSKCGRDKGKPFVVVELGDGHCYLADGKARQLANPKRKKEKHVQITNHIDEGVRDALLSGDALLNADLRKALAAAMGPAKDPAKQATAVTGQEA